MAFSHQRKPRRRRPHRPLPPTFDDLLEDFTPAELRELADDAADDDAERAIHAYARQREAEERTAGKLARFGRVYPIGREDYTREVTEASSVDEPGAGASGDQDDDDEDDEDGAKKGKGQGTGVVCFLYKDGQPASERTFTHIRTLAARHPRTKFVSIVGDKCIPNLPDSRVPMIIVYRKGEIRHQVMSWGADRERTIDELEILLLVTGAIIPPERLPPKEKKDDDSEDEDSDFADDSRKRSAATSTNGRTTKNIRGPAQSKSKKKADDSDSDFDFDL
ncbi:Thioredoxin-like protein [Mycena sanguinolenta]|uniref:Thioredoxin-like protein n=1 Tax=Mycena sanguinolenta TaxID=230812 RepID=A0A8H6Z5I9_9AGAR|nr:Thioredoxin-like protein [Mycena sanguinolenta]